MNMKSYEGQTFMTQVISKRVYALVAGPRTPKKERCADGHRQGSRLPSPVHGCISEAVDEPCGLSANLQVLRLASTAGSLHKHISPAPGGFVSNIWIVCKKVSWCNTVASTVGCSAAQLRAARVLLEQRGGFVGLRACLLARFAADLW